MSVPGQESGAYGGKTWGQKPVDAPPCNPLRFTPICNCSACTRLREATEQNKQEVG